MAKKLNYNYAFVFYDVNEKRVQKVFKICKKYLSHYQNSVFRGEITPSKLIGLKTDLKKVIQEDEDFICIIKLFNENVFGEEVLGKKDRENGEQLFCNTMEKFNQPPISVKLREIRKNSGIAVIL